MTEAEQTPEHEPVAVTAVAVDANQRFAERLAREVEGALGVGIALDRVHLDQADRALAGVRHGLAARASA